MLRFIMLLLLCIANYALGATPATTLASSRPGGEVVAPPRRDVPGKRIALSVGELYVPAFFGTDHTADVVVWFLGAPWCAEQAFYDARKNAVLLVASPQVRKRGFADAGRFRDLLQELAGALNAADVTDEGIGRVCIGSFSDGYKSVRDILAHAELRNFITDVVLADSLYAPRVQGAENQLDPAAMEPFLRFARLAADGKRSFIFSHLYPPEQQYRGNTTTLAASYLIDALNIPRQPAEETNSRGAKLLYRAELNGLHILGYAGMTNQDHFDHFYAAADLLKMTSLADARR